MVNLPPQPMPQHGGPDAFGPARHDFSTNANACGPCPHALAAVQQADATRYPDPSYTALRQQLAQLHSVAPWQVVLAASASEFITRATAYAAQQGARSVCLPPEAYGDYARAAAAWGLAVDTAPQAAASAPLGWACEPSSPLGQAHSPWPQACAPGAMWVLDAVYEPLRLSGQPSLPAALRPHMWQLHSPNKALGLTGIRAAYAIAPATSPATAPATTPVTAQHMAAALDAMAPSWVLGAHGVALLKAWAQPATHAWVRASLPTLRVWKAALVQALQAQGWVVLPSHTPFFCAQPPPGLDVPQLCQYLRQQGVQLRNAASLGMPGWVRLGVLGPSAQAALLKALAAHAHFCHVM